MNNDEYLEKVAELRKWQAKHRFFNWWVNHDSRYETAYVNEDYAAIRWLMIRRVISIVLGGALVVALPWAFTWSDYVYLAIVLPTAFLAGSGASIMPLRALSYRAGFLKGRQELYEALREAERRGMDTDEFIAAMMDRDFRVPI